MDAKTVGAVTALTGVSVRTPARIPTSLLPRSKPMGSSRPRWATDAQGELHAEGKRMSMDDAITYALAGL